MSYLTPHARATLISLLTQEQMSETARKAIADEVKRKSPALYPGSTMTIDMALAFDGSTEQLWKLVHYVTPQDTPDTITDGLHAQWSRMQQYIIHEEPEPW